MPKGTFWVISLAAGVYSGQMWVVRETGNLDPTAIIVNGPSLATLWSFAPPGTKRIPRFAGQAAAVVENWV